MPETPPANSNQPVRKPRRINSLYLFAALLAALVFINYRPDIPGVACTDDIIATQPDVVMLGTVWCPYCASARRYFHSENIDYCEYDIERTEKGKRMYSDMDGGGIPILIVGDKYRINGFDERTIERALALVREEYTSPQTDTDADSP